MNALGVVFWPIILAFALTFMFMPFLIAYFRAKKEGQMIKMVGPNWHSKKSGTPTMGGSLFIITIIIAVVIMALITGKFSIQLFAILTTFLIYGLIGAFDDSIKIFHHQNEGFKAWQKATCQIGGGIVFYLLLLISNFDFVLNLGFATLSLGILYLPFLIFWMVGWSNAVNLTDGLDGLVAGVSIISYLTFAILALSQQALDIAIFDFAVVGAVIAFFWYNKKPAKIFMGDTGSLALGAGLALNSIVLHHEFLLLLIAIIPMFETLSVILQVFSFHFFHRRIFKMSPVHHHFEMLGWSEWKVDGVFWIVTLVGCALSLLIGLK